MNVAALFDDEDENYEKPKQTNNNKKDNVQSLNRKVSEVTSTQSISHSTKPNVQPARNPQNNYSNQGPPQGNNRNINNQYSNQGRQPLNNTKPQNNRNSDK